MTTQSIFCEVCALICHEECKKSAFSCPPKVNDQQPSYDVRKDILRYMSVYILNLFLLLVGIFCQDL
jgi:hypothetical protein